MMTSSAPAPIILIIEDDPLQQTSAAFALTQAGYRALTAGSTREAFAVIRRLEPDLVLLDIGLPDGNGWEMGRWLKSAGLRFIIVSAHASDYDLQHGQRVGAEDYLIKPVSLSQLVAHVNVALQPPQAWSIKTSVR